MSQRPIIAASILAADPLELGKALQESQEAGADWIHVDIMDGHFVPSINMGPRTVEACKRVTDLPIDVHLMIENPDTYIEQFVHAGADSITVHTETCPHLHRTVSALQEAGMRAGVALNPATPVSAIEEIMGVCDMILVMTVNPGFGGQSFIKSTLGKIKRIHEMMRVQGLNLKIEVDGGIDSDTAPQAVSAGADVLVAGNSIFNHPEGISEGIQAIRASFSS
jgi:ribulose-phosphate 3-epimerase